MKTVADFEDFIALSAPDAGSIVLQHVVREAIVRFMRESQLFNDVLCFEAQCGVNDYPLQMPDCRRLVGIEVVSIGGYREVQEFPELATGTKFREWHKDDRHNAIVLHHAPKEGTPIRVLYSWAIQRDDCEIPDEMYEDWMEAVKSAALSELLMMPKQEWTSPATSAIHEDRYRIELHKAKNRRWSNYSRGPMMMQGDPFLRGRHRGGFLG